jgi:hypothetical protein
MDRLRIPFFAFAIFFFVLAILTEVAAGGWLAKLGSGESPTPGVAITYLGLIDGLIAWSLLWMVLSLIHI